MFKDLVISQSCLSDFALITMILFVSQKVKPCLAHQETGPARPSSRLRAVWLVCGTVWTRILVT